MCLDKFGFGNIVKVLFCCRCCTFLKVRLAVSHLQD